MTDEILRLGVLNVVAHPHPEGIYPKLLFEISGRGVNFWGSDFAAVTKPIEVEKGVYQGRIVIWTQIDPNEPAIDLKSLDEVPLDKTDARLPSDVGFNGRVFLYTLNEPTHLLFVETKNEFDKHLSPSRAKRIFSRLFSSLPDDNPLVEVTIVPDEDSVERLLGLHRMDFVQIHLTRPNAEEFGDIVQTVLDDLTEAGAKSQDVIFRRSAEAPTITLPELLENVARVASYHGWFAARGRDEDGNKIDGSTREYPKIIESVIGHGTSLGTAAIRVARNFVPRIGPRRDL